MEDLNFSGWGGGEGGLGCHLDLQFYVGVDDLTFSGYGGRGGGVSC